MTESGRERFSPPNLGGVSLLVSFAVLCLTVFALLSLSTVRADARLGEASVRATADYYAADLEAQTILARLRNGEQPEGVSFWGSGLLYADYAVPISDAQELQVRVLLRGLADREYEVLRWQAVNLDEWDFDDALDLWDGEPF